MEQDLKKAHELLQAVNRAQSRFISGEVPHKLFNSLLGDLVRLTGSEYGFIDEVRFSPDGVPSRVMRALTDICWNDETRKLFDTQRKMGFIFPRNDNLAGVTIRTGKPVISNDAANDPRSGGLPSGHPPLRCFLGLPLYSKGRLIGTAGVANRPDGYNYYLVEFLEPFLSTCANIMEAYCNEERRNQAEDRVRKSLSEKEILLREVHHRVKNNLAVVSSLLNLQSHHASEKTLAESFDDVQARIRSMALVHELLYRAKSPEIVDVREYLDRLVSSLFRSMDVPGRTIRVTQEIEPLDFKLDTAIPVGLLVTELVSNCLKHAFPGRMEGEVRIALRSAENGQVELVVADNGVGIPAGVNIEDTRSLGLQLVGSFVQQLHGGMEIRQGAGTEIRITMKRSDRRA